MDPTETTDSIERSGAAAIMRVRPAVAADGRAIAEVNARGWQVGYSHIFSATYLHEMGRAIDERAARVVRAIAEPVPPGSRILVAEWESLVIGYTDFGPARPDDSPPPGRRAQQSPPAEIYAFYVDPSVWRRGAGTLLMAGAIEDLRRMGYREAVLWVLEANARARAFYESTGWQGDSGRQIFSRRGEEAWEVRYRRALD